MTEYDAEEKEARAIITAFIKDAGETTKGSCPADIHQEMIDCGLNLRAIAPDWSCGKIHSMIEDCVDDLRAGIQRGSRFRAVEGACSGLIIEITDDYTGGRWIYARNVEIKGRPLMDQHRRRIDPIMFARYVKS